MQLAIGDVVRDLDDMILGSVVGFGDDQTVGRRVVLQLSGGSLRTAWPHKLELVARSSKAMTSGQRVGALIVTVIALVAGLLGAVAELAHGADLLLSALTGLGSACAVLLVFHLFLRMTSPRRFRV